MLYNNIIDFIILSLIGIFCGISMGSIGIGGGVIVMPLLILYGVSLKTAVACIMVMQLFPQSILGVINYYKDINWYISLIVLIGSFIGIYIGSYIVSNNYIYESTMYKILTILLIFITIYFSFKYLL